MRALACVSAILLISTSAFSAPPQLAELTASDGNTYDNFGVAVAMGGNTVVVGAPGATVSGNYQEGKAYVFVKPESGWSNMTQVAELTPSDGQAGSVFGNWVAVSGDTIVIGSDLAAYIFVKPLGGWTNMTETAELPRAIGPVAISGGTIVSTYFADGVSTVEVFLKPKGGWVTADEPNATLKSSDLAVGDGFATSLAISGNAIIAGAPDADNQTGAAYVFVKSEGGWTNMTQTAKLTASYAALDSQFGVSVAINANTIVIGAPGSYNNPLPTAYVFVQPGGGWANMTETAQLLGASGEGGPFFAQAVAISGKRIVAGEPGGDLANNFQGESYIFTEPKTGWQTTSKYSAVLTASDDKGEFDEFGLSVAMSGARILIGTLKANLHEPGAAYVF
jgi:FG-GAP repeat protein